MALPKELKTQAFNLYMQGNDPIDILDKISALKPTTLYSWIKKENWADKREKRLLNQQNAGDILLENLEKLIQSTQVIIADLQTPDDDLTLDEKIKWSEAKANLVAKFSDSVSKISKTITSHYKQHDRLGQILYAFGEFKMFVSTRQKSLTPDFRNILELLLKEFQNHALNKFSNNG